MHPEDRDAAYLWDMWDAARAVRDFVVGTRSEDYIRDRMKQMAVERALEIIGEAARGVSDGFKQAHPEIPWRALVVQRNVLAHDYWAVEQDRLWTVATVHMPKLAAALEPLVPALPREPED
jgi:uncharacterized protein with HEPN domain